MIAACAALAVVLAAYPPLTAPRLRGVVLVLGVLGLVVLGVAIVRERRLLGVALAALAGEFVALDVLARRGAVVLVLYAAALLVLGELAAFAGSLRAVELLDREVVLARVRSLGAVALGGVVVATVAQLASRVSLGGGIVAAALGVGATVALLALITALARSRHPEP